MSLQRCIKPKKHFGQNFLSDSYYLDKIIESIPSDLNQHLFVEIGAGLGDLTSRLLECGPLLAYEIDYDLKPYLLTKFHKAQEDGRLQLIFGNICKIWNQKNLFDFPYILISNLPYYIATTLILKALRDIQCKALIVMTQKEVAEKFCAQSGTSECSPLCILVESIGTAQKICDVPSEAFNPPPKVESSVFLIKREKEADLETLESFLRIAFEAPRKKLFKNLQKKYDAERLAKSFEALELSCNIRAHELTTPQYHQLIQQIRDI